MTLDDYRDTVAYELPVLDSVVKLISKDRCGAGLDLDSGTATIVPGIAGGFDMDECRRLFAPMLFGAAWKVLDVTVEYVLSRNSVPRPGVHWPIKEKLREAKRITAAPDIPCWTELLSPYERTIELRNSVVHRRILRQRLMCSAIICSIRLPKSSFVFVMRR